MAGLLQNSELFGVDIPRLEGLREKGRAAFCLPSPKIEAWKYTKLHALKADDFVVLPSRFLAEIAGEDESCDCGHCHAQDCGCEHEHCNGKDVCSGEHPCDCGHHCHGHNHEPDCYLDMPFAAWQLHFYNGQFVPIYPALPRGVEVMTIMEAIVTGETGHLLGKYIDFEKYPFAALNTAYLEEGLFIRVAAGVKVKQPLLLVNHSNNGGQNLIANIHNLVVLEEGAELELAEYYHYSGEEKSRYFNNIVNEIYMAPQSSMNHYKFQDEAYKAVHIALNTVRIKQGGIYNSFCLQKGGDIGRNETRVQLLESGAKAEVNSAYLMNGWATLDTTTDIEHLAEKTFSSQLIKGVVGGEARGVFQGKIHIAKDAQETEGRQLHRALLLSDTAEIDVKPELEIFADNVKCSHGAASGELDKEQLFYMQSRGIGAEQARQILIDAYLTDVVSRIENLEIRDWLQSRVQG